MTIKFTDFEPPKLISEDVEMSSMNLSGSLQFEQQPEGSTLMRWSWDLKPRGLLGLLGPVVALMGRRQEKRIWTNLKRLMEEGRGRQA
jgi:hypothetical protein